MNLPEVPKGCWLPHNPLSFVLIKLSGKKERTKEENKEANVTRVSLLLRSSHLFN